MIYKIIIKIILRLHTFFYRWSGFFSVKAEGGVHPKHRLTSYHSFFINNIKSDDRVLDIGCGRGELSFDLAKKAKDVVGIDFNEKSINWAKNRFSASNIKYILGNATKDLPNEKFDALILSNVLEHIKNRIEFLSKIKDLGDRILIRVPMINRDWITLYKKELGLEWKCDRGHFIEYTLEIFQKELKQAGLSIQDYSIQFGEIWAVVERGSYEKSIRSDEIKIVGISLIKNEDLYIERVLKNVINFCDEIIVLDNMSEDNTFKIVNNLSNQYPKIKLSKIKDAFTSHKFVEKYANTDTWVFAIDGDEVYDPIGLERLREEILTGKYQNYWSINGNSLNSVDINYESKITQGYLSPPSRPMTKLLNFSILESWKENCQRLHGKSLIFKKGFDATMTYKIYNTYDWDNSYFRMLHLCFINRTSLAKKYKNTARLSPEENSHLFPLFRNFISNLLKGRLTLDSEYKLRKYKKGQMVTKKIHPFFYQ